MYQLKESNGQSETRGTLIIFVAIKLRNFIVIVGRSRMNREIQCVQERPVYPERRKDNLSRAKLSSSKAE